MKQVNVFHKGIVSDIDYTLVQPDMWVFPTVGVRITNLTGKGFVVQNIDGTKEIFTLGAKNIPLGSVEHNGILYIATHNTDTNEGTIGCYPSPQNWTIGSNGLVNQYKPLKNFSIGGVRSNLTTTLFNFSPLNMISMQAKTSYDGSTDIYLADYRNPLRMINSGFISGGLITERVIEEEDFNSFVNVIQSTANSPRFAFKPFGDNGDLLNGTYFVYARYVTDDFNTTEFLAESFAFSLYQERTENNAFSEGGISSESSNHSINFTLSNIDQSYKYLEFALIRYFGDNGPVQYESYLYNQYFAISSETMDINLSYMDRVVPFPEQDILAYRNRDIIPKDIVYFDNTLWGVNWKEKDRYRKVLEEYSKRIMIFPEVLPVEDIPYDENSTIIPTIKYYRPGDVYENPQYIYENVGYFRGETYAFASNFLFTDGDITDGFPTAGRDDYNNDTCYVDLDWEDYEDCEKFNQDGIYRTPKADLICDDNDDKYQLLKENERRLLYLRFDFEEANRWLNEDCSDSDKEWFVKNIKSLRLVRSERKENLITQGVAFSQIKVAGTINNILAESSRVLNKRIDAGNPTSELQQFYPDDNNYDDNDLQTLNDYFGHRVQGSAALINERGAECKYPFYKGFIPAWGQYEKNSKFASLSYVTRGVAIPNDYGLFSPDFAFNRAMYLDDATFVKRIGRNVTTLNEASYYNDVRPLKSLVAMNNIVSIDRDASKLGKKAIGMKGNETIVNGGGHDSNCICNAYDLTDEAKCILFATNTASSKKRTISNRNFNSIPYISLLLDSNESSADEIETMTDLEFVSSIPVTNCINYNLDSINLCKSNPDILDILNWYDKNSLFYKPICEFIDFSLDDEEYIMIDYINAWRGDCFLNRCTLNLNGWTSSECRSGNDGSKQVIDSLNDVEAGKYGWDWADWMTSTDHLKYAHGLTMSFVTENKYNIAYRYHNRKSQNTYFDKEVGGGSGSMGLSWLIRCWTNTKRESLLLNTGNSIVIPQKLIPIYPYLQPFNSIVHPVRIRFSGKYTPGAFIDATRKFDVLNYKDFDYAFGAINAIYQQGGMLISIQDSVINRHFVNEKALSIDAEGNSVMLGSASEYLAQQVQNIGNFGSKHKWSTYASEHSVYGVDWDRNIIWNTGYSSDRKSYGAADITLSKSVSSWLKELYETYNPTNNPLYVLKDTPANNEGIIIGYDRLNKEVLFTFIFLKEENFIDYGIRKLLPVNHNSWFNTEYDAMFLTSYNGLIYSCIEQTSTAPVNNQQWEVIDNDTTIINYEPNTAYSAGDIIIGYYDGKLYIVRLDKSVSSSETIDDLFESKQKPYDGLKAIYIKNYIEVEYRYYSEVRRTLVFSEKLGAFVGEYPFKPNFYALLDNYMFSSNPNDRKAIHIHNDKDNIQKFYGNIEEMNISFVVTGQSGEESAAMLMKYFMSLDIEINDVSLSKITYKTDVQEGIYIYSKNSSEFWKDAEYFENKMKLPIFVQTNPVTEWENESLEMYKDSDMKGTYMVITLHYNPTEAEKVTLRNAITNFNISQS